MCFSPLLPVQSQVLGMYVLHGSMGSCGAPELLAQLDDAISDAMGETQPLNVFHLWFTNSRRKWCDFTRLA
jgi:hypothetical protein